ncbi:MAG: substrate-binding periplasmic protein [Pseudoalteromonas sp.]
MLTARLIARFFFIALLLMVCINYSGKAAAVELNTDIITLEISAGEWPPFLSNALPHQGVVAHLISDIYSEAGIKVNFTFLPWSRAYHDTLQNKYAATAVWMHSPDRTPDYLYSDAVLSEKFVFFYNKKSDFDWQQLTDLNGLLLGGGLGYSYGPKFDKALAKGGFDMSRVNSTEQNFRRLALGRIDAFAEEQSVGYYILNHQLPELADDITHHTKPLLINKSFLLFPKNTANSEKLLSTFNQQLVKFKQSGRYDTYFKGLEQGDYQ